MKIDLIYYLYELNGAYTSFEDLFYNLRKYTNWEIRLIVFFDDKLVVKRFKRYFGNESNIVYLPLKYGKMHYDLHGNACVISSEVIDLVQTKTIEIDFNKTFLFYPAFIYKKEISQHEFDDMISYINDNGIITICNKFNAQFVKRSFIWYMKFSEERINRLKQISTNDNEILTSEEYFQRKKNKLDIKPFSYKRYDYFRYSKKSKDNPYTEYGADYYENIGKMMFEFLLLGKESSYSCKDKKINDGLTEFLNEFGIDDNFDFDLNLLSKSKLYDVLFMKHDDKILKLLKG
jgi:hypothetical protein